VEKSIADNSGVVGTLGDLDQKGFSSFKITTENGVCFLPEGRWLHKTKAGENIAETRLVQIRSALCLFTSFWKNIRKTISGTPLN